MGILDTDRPKHPGSAITLPYLEMARWTDASLCVLIKRLRIFGAPKALAGLRFRHESMKLSQLCRF